AMSGKEFADRASARGVKRLVFSPHLDDAALSLGATIARWARRRERVLVVTLCAGAPRPGSRRAGFAASLQGEDGARAVALRRAEDRRALALLGADLFWDDALDAIDRRAIQSGEDLFRPPDDGDPFQAHAFATLDRFAACAPEARL